MRKAIWAPSPRTIAIAQRGQVVDLTRDQHGVAWSDIDQSDPYLYIADGQALPDPRSEWQPEGPAGPSRLVDHFAYQWHDQNWRGFPLASAIIYELHVGTFSESGDFDGVVAHLDHLSELGVNAIEMLPVAEFPGRFGWGYDGVCLYAPRQAYGGPTGLKRLVDACHHHGLAVVLDVVYNHLGPVHNTLSWFGPYFTERYRTPWGQAVNLDDRGSGQVRRFFIDNALMWLREYHVDGLRIDAVHALFDSSAFHFLEELSVAVDRLEGELGCHKWLIAESDLGDPKLVRPRAAHGFGLDAMWCDDFHHALHAIVTGERDGYYEDYGSMHDLERALAQGFAYDGRYSAHRGRRHGRPPGELEPTQLVACLQNHDQIGNRARGERLVHLIGNQRAQVAAALLLFAAPVPLMFQGEEWAAATRFPYFADHEGELAESVRQGRQAEFAAFDWASDEIPDPCSVATWRSAVLDWSELGDAGHRQMFDWYRDLIALRKRLPMGWPFVDAEENHRMLRLQRGAYRLFANLGSQACSFEVAELVVELANVSYALGSGRLNLEPASVVIGSAVSAGG